MQLRRKVRISRSVVGVGWGGTCNGVGFVCSIQSGREVMHEIHCLNCLWVLMSAIHCDMVSYRRSIKRQSRIFTP